MGKNQSASNLTNVIQVSSTGNVLFVSGSTTLMSISSSGAITTTGVISGSNALSASYASASTSASYSSNADTLASSFTAFSSSILAQTASFNAFSASIYTATSSFSGRVGALESYTASLNLKTASFATTGSNNFTAVQHIADTTNPTGFDTTASLYTEGGFGIKKDTYISSSLYIKGNLTVYGTQSVNYITSSQLNISTNLITVNTATPSVRFGGIAVQDSGSVSGLTGSLLWDSQNNSWLYNNPSGSGNYDSAMVIMGPRNSSTLGSEVGLSCNYLIQGHGHHHTTSSAIYHDSVCTNFYSNALFVSASGNVGIGANNPRWQIEICGNNACTGAGGYPGISINNGCTTGYSGLYLYNGINQQGGIEASNSTGNILVNALNILLLQTASNNRISIANTGAVTLSCQLYLDGCKRDTVFVKSDNTNFSRLFYAGNNQIIFHNGGTTANSGAWGLNNYEDTLGLFRVYNSGISCWYGGMSVCGNISIMSTCSKFYQQTTNCKPADSVLDIYNTATNGFGVAIQAGANNNNYALSVTNHVNTPLLHVAGNGQVGIGCSTPNAKLTINNGDCIGSIRFYGSNASYTSQVGWYDSTNVDPAGDGIGGQRIALIEIGTVAGTGTGCRGANMGLYTHEANGSLKLPLLLMHTGNVCLPQGNLYTTCTLFAPGTPIQIVTGNATVTSGAQGSGYSMGSSTNGNSPTYNQGLQIASTSFTPKSSTSKILIMTNNVVMWERSNVSDHFYLWAANTTDGTTLVKSGQYLNTFGPGGQNGGIINLNGTFSSWGTSAKTISFRIGTTGGDAGSYFEYNPYYGASGFTADTVGNFTWTIMEIAQ